MSTPNSIAVALNKDLHRRMKRILAAMALADRTPPSIVAFVNESVAARIAREEKKFDVSPAA